MKAVILAAGRGSRMRNLTDDIPKCLIEIGGRPLIDWQIEALNGIGIYDIAVVTGYRSDLISGRNLHEFHNPKWAETQMLTSLLYASEWLATDDCIVSYSDIFYEANHLFDFVKSPSDISIMYDPNWLELWGRRFENPLSDAETFLVDGDSNLVEIGSKPNSVDEIQGQYMGLLRFSSNSWHTLSKQIDMFSKEQLNRMHMTHFLQSLITSNSIKIKAIPYHGTWGEMDTVEDLNMYRDKFKN